MATSKQKLADYLLETRSQSEDHHIQGTSLEVIMHKFTTLSLFNCCNFVCGAKHFVRSEMGNMDGFMAFKDHPTFKFIDGSQFPRKSKMFVDLMGTGFGEVCAYWRGHEELLNHV